MHEKMRLNILTGTRKPCTSERLALPAEDAAALCGVSRGQWWKLIAAGKLQKPIRLGSRSPRWPYEELLRWLAVGGAGLAPP